MTENDITKLLARLQAGDRSAMEGLLALVYGQLHSLAKKIMSGQPANHTLQPTALVHEAYVRLVGKEGSWEDELHFLRVAATAMRCILIDHARSRQAGKRVDQRKRVDTVELRSVAGPEADMLEIDEIFQRLSDLDPRAAQVLEMRCFGGFTHEEIAKSLEVSTRSVERSWRFARAWVQVELQVPASDEADT